MSTDTMTTDADLLADAQAVVDAITSGKRLDPVIARRVNERAEKIRQEVFEKYGYLDIAVPAIRELRDA
jgi:hypothetical protein